MTQNDNRTIIIGDVHGLIDKYWKLLQKHKGQSIQIGNFGFKRQLNFGNHDDITYLHRPHSLGNWSIQPSGIMTVRGAMSRDKHLRTEGKDWWADEALSYPEMSEAVDIYQTKVPRIMITHDAPHEVHRAFFGITDKTTTSNGL